MEGLMENRPILSSLTSATELEEEVVRERTAEKKTPKDCLMKMSSPFDLPPAVVNLAPEAGRRAGRKPGSWGLDIRAWRWGGVGPLRVVCGGYCCRPQGIERWAEVSEERIFGRAERFSTAAAGGRSTCERSCDCGRVSSFRIEHK
jgi:hypothetical protein